MLIELDKISNFSKSIVSSIPSQTAFVNTNVDYLSKHLRDIDFTIAGKTHHFVSNGKFALHDIAIFLAIRINRPDCIITSFNISEIAARLFLRAWD